MFTIFHVFQLLFPIIGLIYGFSAGQKYFGLVGGVGGAILGLIIGFFTGHLPFLLAWRIANFHGKSTKQLWRFLHDDQYFVFHLVLPELMARGEDVTSEKERIMSLLASDNTDRRRFGWASLQIVFPEYAKQLVGFNPESPTEPHLEWIRLMREQSE